MNPIASNVAAIPRSDFPSARSLRARVTVARATSFAASIASRPPVRRRFAPSRYDVAVRPAFRLSLVVLGLAAVVYGTATLTGDWLGTPPWWERAAPMTPFAWLHLHFEPEYVPEVPLSRPRFGSGSQPTGIWEHFGVTFERQKELHSLAEARAPLHVEPRPGREWISGGVVAAGLALVAFAAWPRRRWTDVSA